MVWTSLSNTILGDDGYGYIDCTGTFHSSLEDAQYYAITYPESHGSCCKYKGTCQGLCGHGTITTSSDQCHCSMDMSSNERCEDFESSFEFSQYGMTNNLIEQIA